MSDESTLTSTYVPSVRAAGDATAQGPALVIAYCRDAPDRVGDVGLLHGPGRSPRTWSIGRGTGDDSDSAERLQWVQQRPGHNRPRPPLAHRRISRSQLMVSVLRSGRLSLENVGHCALRVNGNPTEQATAGSGDVIEIADHLLLLVEPRPFRLEEAPDWPPSRWPEFGRPDLTGLVGESEAAWALRQRMAFIASRPGHVLITGRSGAGKERVAAAIHALSPRAARPLVSRNAATLPAGILDVELFGHVANYPNPGMQERVGLVGQADHGTLFLDEIGELPQSAQAHLLRLLDDGEYQRLGDPIPRRADLRVIAATNRPLTALKDDVQARFRHHIDVPELSTRRSDVPLLLRHLLQGADASEWKAGVGLTDTALRHDLPHQIRSLDRLVWDALSLGTPAKSAGDELVAPLPWVQSVVEAEPHVDASELSAETVQAALQEHNGNQEAAWRALGLKNRYVLRRLIRKYGL